MPSSIRIALRSLRKTPTFTLTALAGPPSTFPPAGSPGRTGRTIAIVPLRRVLTGLLFGVDPSDPWTQAAMMTVLLAAAALGSLGPALRSVRVDPAETLRAE